MSDEDSLKDQARAWEKVFDLCRELGMELDFNRSGLDSVLDFIRARHAAGVAAELARDKWISVLSSLPKPGVDVLLRTVTGEIVIGHRYVYADGGDGWKLDNGDDYDAGDDVTRWCPIPDAPKRVAP